MASALADFSLLANLDDIVERCPAVRRVEILRDITNLFISGANAFAAEHIKLFDNIFNRLIVEVEAKARCELSVRLAVIDNAPPALVRRLALDDNIAVAAPLLQYSEGLQEPDLLEVAKNNSQKHLLAISHRKTIGPTITDILVRRGDREVVRNVAQNPGACLSDSGFSTLVRKAHADGILAEKISLRSDFPPPLFRELLLQATTVVQRRLFAVAAPEIKTEIRRILAEINQMEVESPSPDYVAAQESIAKAWSQRKLDEAAVVKLADEGKHAETAIGLSELSKLPIAIINRIMAAKDPGGILLVCKATGLAWTTVRAIILLRTNGRGMSPHSLDSKCRHFERLSVSTAQQLVSQWQMQHEAADGR